MDFLRSALAGTQEFLHNAATNTHDTLVAIRLDQLPRQIQDYIVEHPYQTAFYGVNGVVFVAPFVVAGPLLGAAGFTAVGPAANSMAAGVQGASVAAGSVFATLQSAAMGGYGAAVVSGIMQAGATAGAGTMGAWSLFCGGRDSDGGNDGDNNNNDGNGERDQGSQNGEGAQGA